MPENVRRLIALFVALTLVVAGATQVVRASDMAVKMSAVSTSDMSASGGCGECDGDDSMPNGCFALCGINMAAVLPSAHWAPSIILESLTVPFFAAIGGHHGPPDPYPPRPISLG